MKIYVIYMCVCVCILKNSSILLQFELFIYGKIFNVLILIDSCEKPLADLRTVGASESDWLCVQTRWSLRDMFREDALLHFVCLLLKRHRFLCELPPLSGSRLKHY